MSTRKFSPVMKSHDPRTQGWDALEGWPRKRYDTLSVMARKKKRVMANTHLRVSVQRCTKNKIKKKRRKDGKIGHVNARFHFRLRKNATVRGRLHTNVMYEWCVRRNVGTVRVHAVYRESIKWTSLCIPPISIELGHVRVPPFVRNIITDFP